MAGGIPTTGSLEIIIQMPSETGANTNETPSPSSPQSIENTSGNPTEGDKSGQVKLSMVVHDTVNIGKQAINAMASNIGLATGNYYAQSRVQKTISGAQTAFSLGIALIQNPYLAAVQIAGLAISAGSEMYQQNREREIANYQAEQYAKRLGYTRDRR